MPSGSSILGCSTASGCAWLDAQGRLFLDCDMGFGLVHSLDTGLAARAIEAGDWQVGELDFEDMPRRFGYVLRPQDIAGPNAT